MRGEDCGGGEKCEDCREGEKCCISLITSRGF